MKLDHELTEWKRTLHPAVAILSPQDFSRLEPQNWAYNRTQTVLTLRYLSVRLVLYRKVLEKALDDASNQRSANDDLDYSPPIAQAMLQICVDSAITMIKLVGVAAPRTDMLPAWWFTAYYGTVSMMPKAPLPPCVLTMSSSVQRGLDRVRRRLCPDNRQNRGGHPYSSPTGAVAPNGSGEPGGGWERNANCPAMLKVSEEDDPDIFVTE